MSYVFFLLENREKPRKSGERNARETVKSIEGDESEKRTHESYIVRDDGDGF